MYQIIVLGLGFSLLLGGAYYINKSDGVGVLGRALSSDKAVTYKLPPTAAEVAGEYVCNINSGCVDDHTVKLDLNGDVHLATLSDNGREISKEDGLWKFEKGGFITLLFLDSLSNMTHTMLIQSVSTSSLAKFVFDSKFYTGMRKPVFIRQGN